MAVSAPGQHQAGRQCQPGTRRHHPSRVQHGSVPGSSTAVAGVSLTCGERPARAIRPTALRCIYARRWDPHACCTPTISSQVKSSRILVGLIEGMHVSVIFERCSLRPRRDIQHAFGTSSHITWFVKSLTLYGFHGTKSHALRHMQQFLTLELHEHELVLCMQLRRPHQQWPAFRGPATEAGQGMP